MLKGSLIIPLLVAFVMWTGDACAMSTRLQRANQSIHAANARLQLPPSQW